MTPQHPEARAWSARILEALERGPATAELALLLTDPDGRVRESAIGAIQEVDLRETGWLEDTVVRFFGVERREEAEFFAYRVAAAIPAAATRDLTQLAEAYLDENPGNPAALSFLAVSKSAPESAP